MSYKALKTLRYLLISAIPLSTGFSVKASTCQKKDSLGQLYYDSADTSISIKLFQDQQNAFAWDLYREIALNSGNIALSPYSVSQSIAMAMTGAAGDTKAGMMNILGPGQKSSEDVHFALSTMIFSIDQRLDRAYELKSVNQVWTQTDMKIKDYAKQTLSTYYDTTFRELDFYRNHELSRKEINQWVFEETNELIKELIPENGLNELTRMVLTDAIYYKGSWLFPFDKRKTSLKNFYGETANAETEMMAIDQTFYHYKTEKFQSVELPIIAQDGVANYEQSFIVILPEPNYNLKEIEHELDDLIVSDLLTSSEKRRIHLELPKFSFSASHNLKDSLSNLGMKDAFDSEKADFSNLFESPEDIYLSNAFHKGFIDVHEEGLEAAGATALVAGCTSADTESIDFLANRPFVYFIYDRPSQTVLFIGRYSDI